MSEERPLVGISACLLGERVRYDGRHKACAWAGEVPAGQVEWLAVCPEVGIGLGVPRPALALTAVGDAVRVRRPDDPSVDVTDALARYARSLARRYPRLAGYLFKSRSPSCGVHAVPVRHAGGETSFDGRGAYAAELLTRVAALPAIEETGLADAARREGFLAAVLARHRWLAARDDPARRAAFHRRYDLCVRARGAAELPESLLADDPHAYLSALFEALHAPIDRRADAAQMRRLAASPALTRVVEDYAAGRVSRAVACRALAGLPPGVEHAEWFLQPGSGAAACAA